MIPHGALKHLTGPSGSSWTPKTPLKTQQPIMGPCSPTGQKNKRKYQIQVTIFYDDNQICNHSEHKSYMNKRHAKVIHDREKKIKNVHQEMSFPSS